jgi:hypothetical protein
MAKGLRYLIALEKRKRFFAAAGVSQKDFFIASFPKSGNTWLRYLLAFANFPDQEITPATLSALIPSIYHDTFSTALQQLPPPRFIKTHEALLSLYPKTIYIVRDYRDVVVSSFHYLTKKKLVNASISDFLRDEKLNAFGSWEWHVSSALEWKAKHPERILFLKYEELLTAPEKQLQTILDFCGISPKKSIAEIIQSASFANLRKKEEAEIKSGDAYFFRKGISGDWKNSLSEKDAEYLIKDKKTTEVMKKLGYL